MVEIFRQCGLDLPDEAFRRFWALHRLLRERNEDLDLTRIRRFEDMVLKHYVDSALVARMIDLPSPLLDLGTGAGFPGLPLKIVRPDLELVLAEGRGKRLAFLEEACQVLRLEGVRVYPHKVSARFDLPVRGIITRAVESMDRTLERAAAFLPAGGKVIFMKGPAGRDEIEPALQARGRTYRLIEDQAYELGSTGHRRRLAVFERTAPPESSTAGETAVERVTDVASPVNAGFKVWKKILDGRGIRKHGQALLCGPKQVDETLRDFPEKCLGLLTPGLDAPPDGLDGRVRHYRLRPELFRELDIFGAGPPLLLVRAESPPAWTEADWPAGCTLFVPFQDPANVGAVIRTAAAFGLPRVVLLKEAAHPFHPRSLRAAGPTVFRVRLMEGPVIEDLVDVGAPLIALAAGGRPLPGFTFPDAFGLVPGLEGPGLPRGFKADQTLSIPMAPGVESLNAALAAGIALYEWRSRRG